MNCSQSIGALAAALAKAQAEINNPPLDSVNPHFKNRYASLGAHLAAVRVPLAKQALSVVQTITTPPGEVAVTTTIMHASGEWIASTVGMSLPDRATAQQLGSVVSYLRRYSLASMTMIVGEECEDGEFDRVARGNDNRPAPRPEVRSAPAPKPAPAPASAPPPTAAPPLKKAPARPHEGVAKKWPNQGCDAVMPEKVVDRGPGVSAVLFSHATEGRQWVSVPHSMLHAVKLDQLCELEWDWNNAGYFEARSVSKIERKSMKPETPTATPANLDDDVPF
jgi:hypothetical protein